MQSASIETRIKLRLHDAIVAVVVPDALKATDMRQLTRDKFWSRQKLHRLCAGPLCHPFAIDNLATIARAFGYDVHDDGTCVLKGEFNPQPRRLFPSRRRSLPLRSR